MNEHDRKHLLRLAAIARMVEDIYDEAAKEAASAAALAMRMGADGTEPFDLDDYPAAKARIDDLLAWLRKRLEVVVAEGVAGEWMLSEDKNDDLVRSVLGIMEGEDGTLPDAVRSRWLAHNDKAREAFLKRKERGMGLSERVWRSTESLPSEMTMGIDMGILDGKPAAAMARDLKQYLKHPDKLFRRVRDERGILHLSKNAAAFHPGQGVYRSSYQNARRLAVTETNMAYRTADHERWQNLDFVVGIEIHLSSNHTCKGRDGKPHRFEDICDQLKGKYPKDFKFTGWHPHCRCYATSILKTEEEMDADTQRILNGEPVDGDSVNKVEDVPENFKGWMEKNDERVKSQTTVPYFIKDNLKYLSQGFIDSVATLVQHNDAGIITDLRDAFLKIKDPSYITEREVREMVSNYAQTNPSHFYGGLKSVKVTKRTEYYMGNNRFYKKKDGSYLIARGNSLEISDVDFIVGPDDVFNPLREVKSAIRAIAENRQFTFKEEYALESLWHEFRHAAAKGWGDIRKKTDELELVMETVNQFCARRSYGQFVNAIGGKVSHKKEILDYGYGYRSEVSNFGKILKHFNISQSSAHAYFRDRILNTPYENIEGEVVEFLVNRGGLKK